ncbi:hypothetical protein DES40_1245 [Litorimonas taeanensis]|uniref:Uncharacterized protein n=1 Tax=Litorimonas taeanensis TaxID=568099 RepID=A0A420WLL2_9PROT|nr:hypothetical protein [Litorimonas taeanensis]RKQ71913.1 hypothetical protein DES40_1245 [Litorimonas taeanensis]
MSETPDNQPPNLIWDLMRVIGPAVVFVVIFLTLALIVKMNFWLAGGIAFAVALADFLVFSFLKKQGGA